MPTLETRLAAAKWGFDSADLDDFYNTLDDNHLAFAARVTQRRLLIESPVPQNSQKVQQTGLLTDIAALATGAGAAIGISPNVISVVMTLLQALEPVIFQLLSSFLSSLIPAPTPTPAA